MRKNRETIYKGELPKEEKSVLERLDGKPGLAPQETTTPETRQRYGGKVETYRRRPKERGILYTEDATVIHLDQRRKVVVTHNTSWQVPEPEKMALVNDGKVDGPYTFRRGYSSSVFNPSYIVEDKDGKDIGPLSLHGNADVAKRLANELAATDPDRNIAPAGYLAQFIKKKLGLE